MDKTTADVFNNLYYHETFADKSVFLAEGDADFGISDNKLLMDDSINHKGATVWLKKKLSEDYLIKYKAITVAPQLAGNINCFFSALAPGEIPPYEYGYQGKYTKYHESCDMYILTLTGDFNFGQSPNKGYSRFRRDPGFILINENRDIKTEFNKEHTFEIVKLGGRISIKIDNKLIHDTNDSNHITHEGYFGFRTWKTKVLFYDFMVYTK